VGVKQSMNHTEKVETRELQADTAEIEQDAKAVGGKQATEGAATKN
jgi:hypothetical protein